MFAGSLANPKIMAGRNNRNASQFNLSPFEQYSSATKANDYTLMPSQPEASVLPPILNASAAYKAFAEPSSRSLLASLLGSVQ
tara:strand:+ start:72 stop:320 length:249 start_codon:yes stop_codon:yes gene_type:complete